MQFVLKAKNAVKRIAAISTGAVMLGATAFGAVAATDLNEWPSPWIGTDGVWAGLIVVGADAQAGDIVGATDIAAALAQQATSAVSGTGTTTVTGGKSKEIALAVQLNDTTNGLGKTLDDDDLSAFLDSTVSFENVTGSKSYDVHEEINLTGGDNGVEIATGLSATNVDEDWLEDVFLEIPRNSIGYYYRFDKNLDAGFEIENASSTYPREIKFLGKTLKITSADLNTITAQIGEEYFLNVGDAVTITDKSVTLKNVGSCTTSPCSIIIDVDGVQETLQGNTAETV